MKKFMITINDANGMVAINIEPDARSNYAASICILRTSRRAGGCPGVISSLRAAGFDSLAVILHLRDNFFADEPLNKAVSLCKRGEPHAELEQLCLATMDDRLSIAAIQDDQNVQKCEDPNYHKIFNILYTVSRDLDIFNTFKVETLMECRIVSVDAAARGRGMAKELIKRSIELALEHEFRLFKVDATGHYSQRICRSLGMAELKKVSYEDYTDELGEPIFRIPAPHHALCIMVKELP
ncbi:N-acetyltransferase 2 [Operophtera brumata]|uniref:N-acetyltransferase 2 n=1 Tax=Operophtera brumata TaxID=104452 RepID=A0A0L7L0V5_OPEBR|nr:N-acetyltransferase 2 [Operophtera brumata]